MPKVTIPLSKKKIMADYLEQIPGFEKGTVQCVCAADKDSALYLAAQMVSDLLNKWYTNVAFFSLIGHGEDLQTIVKNEAGFTRLFTVNQKNPNLQVILNKARGMVNRKFVRAVIIEGLPEPDQEGWRLLNKRARDSDIPIILLKVS